MDVKNLLVILSLLFLSACATPKYNYSAKSVSVSEPPIGTVNSSTVGDVMLRQGKYKEHDAIFLPTQIEVSWPYTLFPGYYLKQGEDEQAEFFFPSGRGEDAGRIEKSGFADPYKAIMTKKNKDDICVVTIMNAFVCVENKSFEKRTKAVLSQDSFQQTLIYSGRVGTKINIGYREFTNDFARPAFNNDVEYDLSDSSIIAYKGARLEIIDATNQYIKYKVIRNFNNANQ